MFTITWLTLDQALLMNTYLTHLNSNKRNQFVNKMNVCQPLLLFRIVSVNIFLAKMLSVIDSKLSLNSKITLS